MTCPHYYQYNDLVAECAILKSKGVPHIPGPSRSGHPCDACKREWKDKPPTAEDMTSTMVKLMQTKHMPVPSMIEQVKRYSMAQLRSIFVGGHGLTNTQISERLKECEKCEQHFREAGSGRGRCAVCGCYTKEKAEMPTEDCPMKKWPRIELKMAPPSSTGPCGGCST
jgi:hypothetical protein